MRQQLVIPAKHVSVYTEERIIDLELAILGYEGLLQRPNFAADSALLFLLTKLRAELIDLKNQKLKER